MALALARDLYFRMKLGNNPFSSTVEMLAHGEGSCLHYSKVYADLARRAGLEARVYNIYEIPAVGGHNTVEVRIDGRWILIDPSYGLYFTDRSGTPLSVSQLVDADFSEVETMSLVERGKLPRGVAPPSLDKAARDLFAELEGGELPEFDPVAAFSTGKLGVQGPDLIYTSDWAFDLAGGPVKLGAVEEDATTPWLDMMGLEAADGRLVSLHELGSASLHTQKQRYTLTGLVNGRDYTVRVALAYASRPGLIVKADAPNGDVDIAVSQDDLPAGQFKEPLFADLRFTARDAQLKFELSVADGYVLTSSIEAAPAPAGGSGEVAPASTAQKEAPATAAPAPTQQDEKSLATGATIVAASEFYKDHGPERSLDGVESQGDYTAAREGKLPNWFTFDVGRPVVPRRLAMRWNSPSEYATDFVLYGIGEGGETRLVEAAGNKPDADARNDYSIASETGFRQFRLEVTGAAGQDRLLLVSLELFGREGSEAILSRADPEPETAPKEAPVVSNGATIVASSAFYDGYGPENAFDGEALDGNYAAAMENTFPNSVTFDVGSRVVPSELSIVWNSATEYGVSLALYGVGPSGDLPLLDVSGNKPDEDRTNVYRIGSRMAFSRYRLAVRDAAGQSRAVVLSIQLRGSEKLLGDADFKADAEDIMLSAEVLRPVESRKADDVRGSSQPVQEILIDAGELVRPRELILRPAVADTDEPLIQLVGLTSGNAPVLIANWDGAAHQQGKSEIKIPIVSGRPYRYYALKTISRGQGSEIATSDFGLLAYRQSTPPLGDVEESGFFAHMKETGAAERLRHGAADGGYLRGLVGISAFAVLFWAMANLVRAGREAR